jgi:hypothetical protein
VKSLGQICRHGFLISKHFLAANILNVHPLEQTWSFHQWKAFPRKEKPINSIWLEVGQSSSILHKSASILIPMPKQSPRRQGIFVGITAVSRMNSPLWPSGPERDRKTTSLKDQSASLHPNQYLTQSLKWGYRMTLDSDESKHIDIIWVEMNLLIISKGITCVEKPKQFHIDHIEVEERDI